jgi:hypothetical protein
MRHEYLSVYQLENNTINSNTINVDEINVGGGGLVEKTWDFAVDGHVSGSHDIFTITGDVRMKLLAICETSLAGGGAGAQVTLGFNGATTNLIGQTTATGIDAGEIWTSSTIASNLAVNTVAAAVFDRIVSGYTSVKINIVSASTSTGKIHFYCWWEPLSAGSAVAAA